MKNDQTLTTLKRRLFEQCGGLSELNLPTLTNIVFLDRCIDVESWSKLKQFSGRTNGWMVNWLHLANDKKGVQELDSKWGGGG